MGFCRGSKRFLAQLLVWSVAKFFRWTPDGEFRWTFMG